MKDETTAIESRPDMRNTLYALLHSRKVLLALVGVIQTLILHYTHVDPEVWTAIDALLLAVIAGIAYEDGQLKRASGPSSPRNSPNGTIWTDHRHDRRQR